MDRPPAETRQHRLSAEAQVTWVIWLTYGCFYFARQNTSAAVKAMQEDYDRLDIAWILGAMKITYGIGQLVNGQLAERLSPRKMLAIGMFGSAALNVAFGFTTGVYFLTFIWACNGWFQSLGWTPCVRVIANWIPPTRRGRALGIIATSYQLLNGVTYIVAGLCVDQFGWRGAFWFPPLILAAAGVHMLVFLKEKPEEVKEEHFDQPRPVVARGHWTENVRATLTNPALWVLAIAMFLLDAVRYFFNDWGMDHLSDVQKDSAFMTSVKYAVLPAGGIIGSLTSGWLTDRYFAGRRTPVLFGFLILLGVLTVCYDYISQYSTTATVFLLIAIGFATFGPHILLVGTAPSDLAKHGTAAAASGFVNFMGYVGAFVQGFITSLLKKHYDWQTAIYFWAGCAFVAAVVVLPLWRVGPRKQE